MFSSTEAGVAHTELLFSYMLRRNTLRRIKIILFQLVYLLPSQVAVSSCANIMVQLSCWQENEAWVGRKDLWGILRFNTLTSEGRQL